MHQHDIGRVIQRRTVGQEAVAGHQFFCVFVAGFRKRDLMLLQIDPVVSGALFFRLRFQMRYQQVYFLVQRGRIFGLPGNNQRRPRFIDQDRIDLIDDRKIQAAHDALALGRDHVIAQIIETEFVVGTVRNVRCKCFLFLVVRHLRKIAADRETEKGMQPPHPFRMELREIVIYRNDMYAFARKCIKVRRQGCDQRLALSGSHFRDLAVVQHHAANHLHIEMAHA